jgi:hypothetical protein
MVGRALSVTKEERPSGSDLCLGSLVSGLPSGLASVTGWLARCTRPPPSNRPFAR